MTGEQGHPERGHSAPSDRKMCKLARGGCGTRVQRQGKQAFVVSPGLQPRHNQGAGQEGVTTGFFWRKPLLFAQPGVLCKLTHVLHLSLLIPRELESHHC